MLLGGGGSIGVTLWQDLILHNRFSFGSVVGAGYAVMGSVMVPAGDITDPTQIPTGVVTMPGPVVLMGPTDRLTSTGFPWTTGQVRVVAPCYCSIETLPSIVTLTGLDDRTPLGAGHIVMVAGGLVHRTVAQSSFAQTHVIDITLVPLDVPATTRAGHAALALALVGAGYALRRRLERRGR
jgi:hypothetical protein